MPINIYIIEAHPFMQCAISKVLRYVSGIHVCGIAATAEEVLGRLPKLLPWHLAQLPQSCCKCGLLIGLTRSHAVAILHVT